MTNLLTPSSILTAKDGVLDALLAEHVVGWKLVWHRYVGRSGCAENLRVRLRFLPPSLQGDTADWEAIPDHAEPTAGQREEVIVTSPVPAFGGNGEALFEMLACLPAHGWYSQVTQMESGWEATLRHCAEPFLGNVWYKGLTPGRAAGRAALQAIYNTRKRAVDDAAGVPPPVKEHVPYFPG